MAMNRNMTMAEKEVRDYAKRQLERAEQRESILFTEEQKEQILEYAAIIGDDYDIRKMVRDLADAVRSSDEEKVDKILWDARKEIDGFPDRSVGMAELKGYGYTADDMFPLRQEMALELHRVGEKVFCLQSDGSHGDYASREMILEHEGLYGIEKEAWQRMQEQEDEIDFEEAGLYQPPMTDLDRDEALRMFDEGETVFLVTTYPRPITVRERMEIERGPEGALSNGERRCGPDQDVGETDAGVSADNVTKRGETSSGHRKQVWNIPDHRRQSRQRI